MSSQLRTLVGKGVGKKYDMSGGQNVNKDHYTEYMSAWHQDITWPAYLVFYWLVLFTLEL